MRRRCGATRLPLRRLTRGKYSWNLSCRCLLLRARRTQLCNSIHHVAPSPLLFAPIRPHQQVIFEDIEKRPNLLKTSGRHARLIGTQSPGRLSAFPPALFFYISDFKSQIGFHSASRTNFDLTFHTFDAPLSRPRFVPGRCVRPSAFLCGKGPERDPTAELYAA